MSSAGSANHSKRLACKQRHEFTTQVMGSPDALLLLSLCFHRCSRPERRDLWLLGMRVQPTCTPVLVSCHAASSCTGHTAPCSGLELESVLQGFAPSSLTDSCSRDDALQPPGPAVKHAAAEREARCSSSADRLAVVQTRFGHSEGTVAADGGASLRPPEECCPSSL